MDRQERLAGNLLPLSAGRGDIGAETGPGIRGVDQEHLPQLE